MAIQKFLFLDIDGVLNSSAYSMSAAIDAVGRDAFCQMSPAQQESLGIDPRSVQIVNMLIAASGAKVVISSSWRKYMPLPVLVEALRIRGFQGDIIGKTPEAGYFSCRGHEIQAWMSSQDPVVDASDIVILDDFESMSHLQDRAVLTNPFVGIKRGDVDAALMILSED